MHLGIPILFVIFAILALAESFPCHGYMFGISIEEAEWQAREMLTFTRISEVESYLEDLRKS